MTHIKDDLNSILPDIKERINRPGGLTFNVLCSLSARIGSDPAIYYPDQANHFDVLQYEDITQEHVNLGEEAIKSGEVAFVILAGDEHSKFMLNIPNLTSLLGWKLLQAGEMPVWVMSSPNNMLQIQQHISTFALPPGLNGVIFQQFEGCRFKPDDSVSWIRPAVPELYPLGHGDLGPALVESGILHDNLSVKRIVVCNVNNVMAAPHPGIIGYHIKKGKSVTCELVEKQKDDRGGVLAWVNNKLQIVEDFRLSRDFVNDAVFLNTNTMIIDVETFKYEFPWRWHRIRKHIDKRIVIQYERLLQQYTEEYDTNFLVVPRDVRYLPANTLEDLKKAADVLNHYQFR